MNTSPKDPNEKSEGCCKDSKLLPAVMILIILLIICGLITLISTGFIYLNREECFSDATTQEREDTDKEDDDGDSDDTDTDTDTQEAQIIYRVPLEVDTSTWQTYTHSAYNVSFMHPPDWTVTEECAQGILDTEICSIEATDGKYIWSFDFDPYVTGGGYGYLFDGAAAPAVKEYTAMEIDGYEVTMVTHYYDLIDLQEAWKNTTFPESGMLWGGSNVFSDTEDPYSLGFGPGEMYDEIDNNTWTIYYRYSIDYEAEPPYDYSDIPIMLSDELNDMLDILDAMTISVDIEQ